MRVYDAYIVASKSRRLYTGVTGALRTRIWSHKFGAGKGFTHRYRVNRLVYHESFGDVRLAIAREKDLKRRSRDYKVRLIEAHNPEWIDLAAFWFDEPANPHGQ